MLMSKLLKLLPFLVLTASIPLMAGFSSWHSSAATVSEGSHAITSAAVHPIDSSQTVLATEHAVYLQLQDRLPVKLWQTRHLNHRIRKILSFAELPDALFVLTSHGCVMIHLTTQKTETIFESSFAREVLSFAVMPGDPDHWLAGTSQGLFESDNRGHSWYSFQHLPSRESYSVLLFAGSHFFVGGKHGLYRSRDLIHFTEVYSSSRSIETIDQNDDVLEQEEQEEQPLSFHMDMAFDQSAGCGTLWLSHQSKILKSSDCGETWAALPASGMRGSFIRRLIYFPSSRSLFAADDLGIYRYLPDAKRWEEIYQGLSDTFARDLFIADAHTLAAVTDDGLMRFPVEALHPASEIKIPSPETAELFDRLIRLEPSARAIHQAVIRYSHTGNEKINRWQAASRLSALLPKISFGRDESISDNIDLDRGSTSDPDVYITGPQDLSRGWDFDVSWDLSNFLFGTAQTSIDSRHKLMVDQRHDLLSEATRIFYERRRLQSEIVFIPFSELSIQIEKRMRLEELTALLDAMTNGFLSDELERIYFEHPELKSLWAITMWESSLHVSPDKSQEGMSNRLFPV